MSLKNNEIRKLSSHLRSIDPPAHLMLLYGAPWEIEALKRGIRAREYPSFTVPRRDQRGIMTHTQEALRLDGWALRCVREEEFSDAERLIRAERRMAQRRLPTRVACAYPIEQFLGLGELTCVDILAYHNSVLFARFSKGSLMLLESTEKALSSALGQKGAEMIRSYMEQKGIEMCTVPLKFPRYLDSLQELLGKGARPLTRLTYKNLFRRLRSSPEMFEDEPRREDTDRDPRVR